jgi:Copper binding periplasmic protein CusF
MRPVSLMAMGLLLVSASCSKIESKPKPLSVPGEKVYTMKGVIVSRDTTDNTVRVDHHEIPGYMEAMTMDYSVRGAEVSTLPADKVPMEARLHVTDDGYWLTDVKKAAP